MGGPISRCAIIPFTCGALGIGYLLGKLPFGNFRSVP